MGDVLVQGIYGRAYKLGQVATTLPAAKGTTAKIATCNHTGTRNQIPEIVYKCITTTSM
jgi:hypothetical protein